MPPPIDYSVLDAVVADRAEQAEVLRQFLQHLHADRQHLQELLAHADMSAVQSAAHRMAGSSRMVGAARLSAACAALEQAARLNELARAPELLAELDEAYAEVSAFVASKHASEAQ